MRIFVVNVLTGEDTQALTERLILEVHAELFVPPTGGDDIHDPYRAVDECDVVVWLRSSVSTSLGFSDYNFLYADTVIQRAVRSGVPVLYYYFTEQREEDALHSLPKVIKRRSVRDLLEFAECLRNDLREVLGNSEAR